jgi:class 3 adenylate cyclase/pSer/pThr/pTyr-binding forkhead associated (FHA) protein
VAARVIVSPSEPSESARELDFDARLTIGRASSNDLVIDQLDCSRNHAEVRRRGDGHYELFDLGSRNGCFVNGHRITGSRELAHGDRIEIAEVVLRFFVRMPRAVPSDEDTKDPPRNDLSAPAPTTDPDQPTLNSAQGAMFSLEPHPGDVAEPSLGDSVEALEDLLPAVVLVSDIVGYRRLLGELAPAPLQRFAKEWFDEAGRAIGAQRGALDKMTGAAVLGYWLIEHPDRPRGEIALALRAAADIASLAEEFAACFADRFGGGQFRIGVGVHIGSVALGNAGATQDQVWTLLGSAVAAAAALESLAAEHGHVVVVSDAVAAHVDANCALHPLGAAPLEPGQPPIQGFALELNAKAPGRGA